MILLENLFGEAAVLNDQDAVSLPRPHLKWNLSWTIKRGLLPVGGD